MASTAAAAKERHSAELEWNRLLREDENRWITGGLNEFVKFVRNENPSRHLDHIFLPLQLSDLYERHKDNPQEDWSRACARYLGGLHPRSSFKVAADMSCNVYCVMASPDEDAVEDDSKNKNDEQTSAVFCHYDETTIVPIGIDESYYVQNGPSVMYALADGYEAAVLVRVPLNDVTELERNRLLAWDEKQWMKIDLFIEWAHTDPRMISTKESEQVAMLLQQLKESSGVSDSAWKRSCARYLGGGHLRSTLPGKPNFSSEVYCLTARRHDGKLTAPDEIPVCCFFPMFRIKSPIMRGDKNTASVDQFLNYGLADYKTIESAILVRVPKLHAERERDNAKVILEALQEKIGPLGNIETLLGDASRKERCCGNCGITWRKSMPRCSRCKAVSYCSRICQEEHYTKHKKQCRKTKKPEEDTATG